MYFQFMSKVYFRVTLNELKLWINRVLVRQVCLVNDRDRMAERLVEQMELQASQTCDKDFIICLSHTPCVTPHCQGDLLSDVR